MEPLVDNVQTLLNAGAATAAIRFAAADHTTPFVAIPENYKIKDLESLMDFPVRKRAKITTLDSVSFIDYLNNHAAPEFSTIYAQINAETSVCEMLAVIDDHTHEDRANWRQHTCAFKPKQSVEWTRWMSKNKVVMKQDEFASWLEDNLPDVATVTGMPTGAEILAMALGFEATYDKRFKSKVNLQNGGVQFEFVEDESKDTRTTMLVFERFTLGIPVFDGTTSAYPLEARIKYRVAEGVVKFWYELIRPDRVFKTAVSEELANIKQGTGLQVISGNPGI